MNDSVNDGVQDLQFTVVATVALDACPAWVAGLVYWKYAGLDQRSYSTLGPVSAWVGDRLWAGKPPRRRTRRPGLLSLSPPPLWQAGMSTRRKLEE